MGLVTPQMFTWVFSHNTYDSLTPTWCPTIQSYSDTTWGQHLTPHVEGLKFHKTALVSDASQKSHVLDSTKMWGEKMKLKSHAVHFTSAD